MLTALTTEECQNLCCTEEMFSGSTKCKHELKGYHVLLLEMVE